MFKICSEESKKLSDYSGINNNDMFIIVIIAKRIEKNRFDLTIRRI